MNEKKQKQQHLFSGRLLRCLSILLLGLLMLGGIPKEVSADVTGSGTESNPYVVTTYAELKSLMEEAPTDRTVCYIELGADISDTTDSNGNALMLSESDQQVVLDLRGHTLSRTANTTDRALFDIKGGSFTIRDTRNGGKNGTIKANLVSLDNVQHSVIHVFSDSGAKVTLDLDENTTVSAEHASMYCIFTEGGNTTIQNGLFTAKTNVLFADGGCIYVYGGTYKPDNETGTAIYNNGAYLNLYRCTAKYNIQSVSSIFASLNPFSIIKVDGSTREPSDTCRLTGTEIVVSRGEGGGFNSGDPYLVTSLDELSYLMRNAFYYSLPAIISMPKGQLI